MDLLTYLATRPGEVLSKERLLDDVWGSQAVSESALTRTITELRQALGDDADHPLLLETIPKRGYRLIGLVTPIDEVRDATAPVTTRATGAWPKGVLAAAVIGVVLLIGAGAWGWIAWNAGARSVRIAVLPFDDLGGNNGDRVLLADGLTEDTIVSLGMIDPEHLTVIRTSPRRDKGATKSLAEIGQELTADYLVEPTIRTEGNQLRLTAKLVRVRDQALVWSKSYERELTSMLGLQLEISADVAEQIRVRLSSARRASLESRHTRNGQAYALYISGRSLWNQRKRGSTRRALEYYKRATEIDPDYALAWSGMADAYTASPINADADPSMMRDLALHAVTEAVRADPNLAEVQTSLGIENFWLERNWPAAEGALRRATVLDASYPFARMMLANTLSHMDRRPEANEEVRRARALDPLDPMIHAISSQIAFHARDYPAAVEHARQAIDVDPEFWIGYMQLGQALEQMGKPDAAADALLEAERLSDGNSKPVSLRGYLLARTGRTSEARAALEALRTRSRERYVAPYAIALVLAGLGERDAVFATLDEAYAARDVHLAFLTVDPKWDEFRFDPRFVALLDRCAFTRHSNAQTR